jgi:hypothetical protein
MRKIAKARALGGFRVALRFDDGDEATVDLSDLAGRGVFAAWSVPGEFERLTIGSAGELTWPCGVDLCPDALYLQGTGRSVSEVFPNLRAAETRCA